VVQTNVVAAIVRVAFLFGRQFSFFRSVKKRLKTGAKYTRLGSVAKRPAFLQPVHPTVRTKLSVRQFCWPCLDLKQ
jgi:hypothetical protein